MNLTGTFDIECEGWSTFVVGALYQQGRGPTLFHDAGDMIDELRARGGTWWAHNGGSYDFLLVSEHFRRTGVRCAMHLSGARISRLVGGGVTLCDSFLLAPMGLDRFAQLIGEEIGDLGWECRCRERCGGYCQIRRRLPPKRMRQLEAYVIRDATVLYKSLAFLRDFALGHQLELRGTLGGSAWATAKARIGLPAQDLTPRQWHRARQAYFGGRVLVGRTHSAHGTHYDMASAYPAALARVALPIGPAIELGGARARRAWDAGSPGLYRMTIDVPEMWIPPLPVRYEFRIGFPVGKIAGTWARPEIEAALVRGCEILAIHGATVWGTSAVLFDSLIDDIYSLRHRLGARTAIGEWLRLFPNAITGKLAESPEREFLRMNVPAKQIRVCMGTAPCTRARCSRRCGSYRQIDDWGLLWAVPCYRPGECSHIAWASYLTATTRVALLDGIDRVGQEFVYSDTDSVWCSSADPPGVVGEGLGQWRSVETYGDLRILAPKVYRYLRPDGTERIRAAGANRLSSAEWSAVARGEQIARKRGVYSIREAAPTGKLFRRRVTHWGLGKEREGGWYGDRILDSEAGVTYPVKHEVLKERFERRQERR